MMARVFEGDPAVLHVPPQVGRDEEAGHDQGQIGPGMPQEGPFLRVQIEPEEIHGPEGDHRLFAEETETKDEAQEEEVLETASFCGLPSQTQSPGPKEDERRVNGHDEAVDGGKGARRRGKGRPETNLPVEEPLTEIVDEGQIERAAEDRGHPHTVFTGAQIFGEQMDEPGHHGGLAEVAPGQMAGPIPVVGLVRGEFEADLLGKHQPCGQQGDQEKPCRGKKRREKIFHFRTMKKLPISPMKLPSRKPRNTSKG